MVAYTYGSQLSSTLNGKSGTLITQYLPDVSSDVKTGTTTPNWWRVRNTVPKPVNPYTRVVKTDRAYMLTHGHERHIYKSPYTPNIVTKDYFDIVTGSDIGSSFYTGNAARRAETDNLSKAKFGNHVSNVIVDLPTELGESRETAEFLLNNVKRAKKLAEYTKLKNGKLLRDAKRAIKRIRSEGGVSRELKSYANDLNNMYLEWTYGAKPLMRSIEDAADLLKNRFDNHSVRSKISGHEYFGTETKSVVTNAGICTDVYSFGFTYNVITTYRYDSWYGGLLLSDTDIIRRESLAQQLGFGFENVIPSLWELTYLSFIPDYFSNIGDVIGNCKVPTTRMNPATLFITRKTVVKRWLEYVKHNTLSTLPTGQSRDRNSISIRGSEIQTGMFFNRVAATAGDFIVSFNFKSPSMGSIVKTLSVATAISGVLGKRSTFYQP